MLKRIIWIVVGALLLVACGGGGGGSGGGEGGDQAGGGGGGGKVVFWHAYNTEGPEAEALNEVVIPRFKEEHPDVEVEAVGFPYDELHQKLVTSTAGGNLPCLVRSDIIWVPELAELGVLVPLDQELENFQELADVMYDAPLATNQWNDQYFGLPLDTNTRVLMYNPAVLKKAGMSEPPATQEDMQQLAGQLGKNEYVFADNSTSGWNMLPWIWSNGGAMVNDDLTKATGALNSEKSVAAVEMLYQLYQDGKIPELILGSEGALDTTQGLAKGRYANILDGPWMFPIFREQFPDFNLQTAKVPEGDAGSISVVGGEDIILTQTCENKEGAMQFLTFMLDDFAQKEMAKVGQLSAREDLAEEMTKINDYYAIFLERLKTAKPRPPHPQWPKMDETLNTELQKAFQGKQSVQQALDNAAQQIDQLLAQG